MSWLERPWDKEWCWHWPEHEKSLPLEYSEGLVSCLDLEMGFCLPWV